MNAVPVHFEVNTPLDDDGKARNIAHALSLGLPHLDSGWLDHVTIIANGPSARDADLGAILAEGARVIAVNGAMDLFLRQGFKPHVWALCDPQSLCASFLPDEPPHDIEYWIASKCDRSVFAKLKGRNVKLWHIRDHPAVEAYRPVKCASSVTLVLISQLRALGYRKIVTHGWDGCYLDGLHHASEGPREPRDGDIELIVGAQQNEDGSMQPDTGRRFQTNTTWALEAQDAVIQLHHADYQVTIHGDGLIRAITGR